ncbi:MAG: DEAD/DEAH box helicase [Granulosicoccus sp.]
MSLRLIGFTMHLSDLELFFSSATLKKARDIVRNRQPVVEEDLDAEDGERYLSGFVHGRARHGYAVQIFVYDDYLDTYCTCTRGADCEHSAALMMAATAASNNSPTVQKEVTDGTRSATRRQELSAALGYDQQALGWVDNLMTALAPGTNGNPIFGSAADNDNQLVYEIHSVRHNGSLTLGVRVMQVHRLKSGLLGKGRQYPFDDYFGFYGNDVGVVDQPIIDLLQLVLNRLESMSGSYRNNAIPLQGQQGAYLLAQILDSGRAYWQDNRKQALCEGAKRDAEIRWQPGEDLTDQRASTRKTRGRASDSDKEGEARLKLTTSLHDNGRVYVADTNPVWYVDPAHYQMGTLRSGYSAALLNAVSYAPELPEAAGKALANLLAPLARRVSLPLPAEPSIRFVDAPLVCRLKLYSADGTAHISQWTVRVMMCYDEHEFHVELQPDSAVTSVTLDDGTEVEVTRDHDHEYRQYQFFRRRVSGFEPVYARNPQRFSIADHQPSIQSELGRFDAFERLFDAFETLEAEGFEIEVEPPVSLEMETVSLFDFDIQPTDNGWFDLALQIRHKNNSYNLLPLVLDWLAKGDRDKPLQVIAVDGSRLSVPPEMIRPVAETLLELYDDKREQLSLTRARAASLTRLEAELDEAGAQSEWTEDSGLRAMAEKVERVTRNQQALLSTAKAPRALKAELREYQLTGMAWLNFLHAAGFCGVLADDMGLGKTIQTLAHILSLRQRRKLNGPCLVVAPTSVLGNWAREATQFSPSLRVRVWHGAERFNDPLEDSDALLVVTSYKLAFRDHDLLAAHGFALLVLDEAQTIKNPSAKITQSLKRLPIEQRLCLTGTPLENHLGELWSLFDFLMPGLLGPQKRFTQHFRTPIEKHGDADRQSRLNNAIAPFMLRRRKQDVAAELPAKTEIIEKIELDVDQARLYESIRVGMEKRVRKLLQERGLAKSHIQMLDALLKLRQSCCHPQLVKLDSARQVKGSAKTEHVMGMIDELVAEGRKIILFSQFTQMLDILEREVSKRKIPFVKLTGKTRKRDEAIDKFQTGDVPLFLISLKAGGTGLNLTAADTVIHYDPWWNPAVENQATDRAHRIGQDKPVFVYKLIASNTVEDKIVAMQARKQALADATIERTDTNKLTSLSAEDILSLFA